MFSLVGATFASSRAVGDCYPSSPNQGAAKVALRLPSLSQRGRERSESASREEVVELGTEVRAADDFVRFRGDQGGHRVLNDGRGTPSTRGTPSRTFVRSESLFRRRPVTLFGAESKFPTLCGNFFV
jgi:hypothetical protein